MTLSRLVVFAIGVVLALVGLFLVINNLHDMFSLIVGGVLLVVGIVILTGRTISI